MSSRTTSVAVKGSRRIESSLDPIQHSKMCFSVFFFSFFRHLVVFVAIFDDGDGGSEEGTP